jgi:hypothetical protein
MLSLQEFLTVQAAGGHRPLCPSYPVLLGYVSSTEQRCGISLGLRGSTSGAGGLLCWLTPGEALICCFWSHSTWLCAAYGLAASL